MFLKEKGSLGGTKDRKEVRKMEKKTILTLGAAALVLGGLIVPKTISAYRGDPNVRGPNCTEERHQEMEQAFGRNDYQAWKNLMSGRGRVAQVINEGNFARFAEAHRLAEEGKIEEARKIREELGLGLGRRGPGKKRGAGQGSGYRAGQ